jgi:hypothetical protein
MGTRNIRSGRKALLLAATASAAATAAGSNAARGGLMVDLRITGIDGQPVPLSQSKSLYAGIGDVLTMAVYAQVSGTNGLNDETVDIVGGSFTSGQGGLLGNLSSTVTAPFGSPGYTNGNQADFDSDGDLDVGSIGTTATNKMAARANPPVGGTPLNANTSEVQIATLLFTVTSGVGSTSINFIPRPTSTGALWNEDGVATTKNPTTGTFAAGSSVTVPLPEPAGAALAMAAGGTGLIARRRGRR